MWGKTLEMGLDAAVQGHAWTFRIIAGEGFTTVYRSIA